MCCKCHTNCPAIFETSAEDGKSQVKDEHKVGDDISKGMGAQKLGLQYVSW